MARIKMTNEGLVKRVEEYTHRMKTRDVPRYALDEQGIYEIRGGSRDTTGYNEIPGLFRGRFVDVVAYAVQQTAYYGEWISSDDAGNCNNGHVKKYDAPKMTDVPEVKGLVEVIGTLQGLKKQYNALGTQMQDIGERIRQKGAEV